LDFCNPGLYGTLSEFKKLNNEAGFLVIRKVMEFFTLRRVKENKDIIDLPDKIVTDIPIQMTTKQVALYSRVIEQVRNREMAVLSSITKLKQIINSPSQYLGDNEYKIEDSGKMIKLLEVAKQVKEKGTPLVVFTCFKEIIPPLIALLSTVFDKPGAYIDGGVSPKERSKIVEQFQGGKVDFLVASIKAANSGLTLTKSSDLVFYDLAWNAATMNQAADRIHRISQTEVCNIYRFITTGTLEEGIAKLIAHKQELMDQLIPTHQEEIIKKEFIEIFKQELLQTA